MQFQPNSLLWLNNNSSVSKSTSKLVIYSTNLLQTHHWNALDQLMVPSPPLGSSGREN
jgi:hypothetical protein